MEVSHSILFEIDLLHAVWDSVRIKLHDNYLGFSIIPRLLSEHRTHDVYIHCKAFGKETDTLYPCPTPT